MQKLVKIPIVFSFSLFFLIPFFTFLKFNHYDLNTSEVIILTMGIIAFGLIYFSLFYFTGWYGKILIFTSSVFMVCSFFIYFNVPFFLLILILSILFAMLFSDNILIILTLFSVVFLLSILVLPMKMQLSAPNVWQSSNSVPNAKLPIVLYLILDEHAGLDSLAKQSQNGKQTADLLQKFYLASGFKIYADAYSHYSTTSNSIPNLLNFTDKNQDNFYFSNLKIPILKQNKLFEIFARMGYQIRVYQPDFIDYTQAKNTNINSGYTYPSLSIKAIENSPLALSDKIVFLTKSLFMQSYLYKISSSICPGFWYQARVSSLVIPKVFKQLKTDIVAHPVGTMFFVHLLAPHNPFVYDANCNLRPVAAWDVTRGPFPFTNTVATRNQRYASYEGQIMCVQKQLQGLFDSMKTAGVYNQAIIIIHGDHGSRIALHSLNAKYSEQLTQQDFLDYYQTLFVAKLPNQKPGVDQNKIDLQTLLAQIMFAITGHKPVTDIIGDYVYLYPQNPGDVLPNKRCLTFS